MTRFHFRRISTRLARQMLVWCVLVALPIYGISALETQWLGPLHFHTSPAIDDDPLAGWQDFRRLDHITDASIRTHTHSHGAMARHHHAASDFSVIDIGSDGHDDVPNDVVTSAAMPLAFIAVEMPLPTARMTSAASAQWGSLQTTRIRSADQRRLERPPKA